jgi:hypothetical protein
VLLGLLDTHDVHSVLMAEARERAAAVVREDPEGVAATTVGRSLDREELVSYVLQQLSVDAP